jgi:hypothetical protein
MSDSEIETMCRDELATFVAVGEQAVDELQRRLAYAKARLAAMPDDPLTLMEVLAERDDEARQLRRRDQEMHFGEHGLDGWKW